MINHLAQFAETSSSASGGLGAFNVNVKTFLFQLVTFLIVLMVLKRWVLPKLVATIEERRKTLEESLVQAKKTQEALASAETKADQILQDARTAADVSMGEAQKQAREVIAKAEQTAGEHAARIVEDAKGQLEQEGQRLRRELRGELADLVAATTEKVLREKLDGAKDRQLIERQVKELQL